MVKTLSDLTRFQRERIVWWYEAAAKRDKTFGARGFARFVSAMQEDTAEAWVDAIFWLGHARYHRAEAVKARHDVTREAETARRRLEQAEANQRMNPSPAHQSTVDMLARTVRHREGLADWHAEWEAEAMSRCVEAAARVAVSGTPSDCTELATMLAAATGEAALEVEDITEAADYWQAVEAVRMFAEAEEYDEAFDLAAEARWAIDTRVTVKELERYERRLAGESRRGGAILGGSVGQERSRRTRGRL